MNDTLRDLVLLAIGAPPAPGEEMDDLLAKIKQAALKETDEMDLWKEWSSRPCIETKKYYPEEDT